MLCHDNWRIFYMHTCIYMYNLNNRLVHYKDGDIYNVFIAYMYMYQLQFYTAYSSWQLYRYIYCSILQFRTNRTEQFSNTCAFSEDIEGISFYKIIQVKDYLVIFWINVYFCLWIEFI